MFSDFQDVQFEIPKHYKNDEQGFLRRMDRELKMFGCVIIQDQFSEPTPWQYIVCVDQFSEPTPWQYIVKNSVFTVRDMMGMGLGIQMILDKYELKPISQAEE
tara:strand:- start:80 stop:388 length:309 start_codon:yes stop_codon:yes gene_type:complete